MTWTTGILPPGTSQNLALEGCSSGLLRFVKAAVSGVLCFPWVPASAGMTWGEGLAYTSTTEFTNVPIPAIDMLTTSPSANVNSGGGIVPVPVHTVVPFGT